MANNKFTIVVEATDRGSLKLMANEVNRLGGSVRETDKATRGAAKGAKDLDYTMNAGVRGTANSTRSFSKLAETIGRNGSSGLVGAYATLAANTFAVTAAFNALRSASQVEQIFRGLEAAGIRTGRSLTSTSNALKEVTGNAISTEQALRATAQITSAGFGSDAVERLGKAARDTSFALGRNMTDSLERLSRGVVKLEPELLDELGIMTKITESNNLYALQLGKTESQLTNFEKRQGFLNAVLNEAELKFGGLAESAGDSTAYDKLAAKLSDLSNNMLNVINTVTKPLAGALSNSSSLILGLVIAAGSGLRNQLVPGLAQAAVKAQEAAAASKTFAKQQIEGIQIARDAARAQAYAALESKKNFDYVGKSGPKSYQAVAASVRAGTATIEEQNAAIVSLNRSLRANETVLKKPTFAPDTAKGQAKLQEQQNIRAEIAAIQGLQAARAAADTADLNAAEKVQQARRAARVASREALAQNAAAASLGAASQLQLGESWKQLTLSVRAYGSAQALASAEGATAMTKLRTAAFAAATGVRTVGVAFLAAMPYLGLVVTALGLINLGIDSMKSDRTKQVTKSFDELSEVTSKTGKYVDEIRRANESTAPAALRAAQAITIQGNAISETNEKLNELISTANTANADNAFLKLTQSLKSLLTLNAGEIQFKGEFNPAGASKLREAFSSLVFDLGNRKDEVTQGAENALKSMLQLAPAATDRIVKLRGGWAQLRSITDSKLYVKNVQEIANAVQKEFEGSADAVKGTQEAFKSLDESLAKFTIGSVISTSFDDVVKNFDSARSAILTLRETVGSFDAGSAQKMLTGIGPNVTQYLDAATEKALDNYRKQDNVLQQLLQKGESLTASERERKKIAEEVVGQGQRLYLSIIKQVDAASQLFENAQKSERTYKGQLDLLNAHIQANQLLYTAAGAGVKARISQENRVRDLQAAQIKLQIDLNHAAFDRQRLRIEELKSMNTMTVMQAEQLKVELAMSKAMQERALQQRGVSISQVQRGDMTGTAWYNTSLDKERGRETGAMIDNYRIFMRDRVNDGEKQVAAAKELESLTRQTRDADAALVNLQNQLATLAEQRLTREQEIAAIREADLAFQNSIYNTLKEQKTAVLDVAAAYEDVNAVINGNNDSLRYQLQILDRAADKQKASVIAENNTKITELNGKIMSARAAAGRANLTDNEKEAGRVLVRNLEDQLRLQEQQQSIDLARIDSQTALNVAQKVYFDTMRDGLDWQRTSLDLVQKQLDAQRNVSDEIRNQYENGVRLAARRAGSELSPQAEQAIEINAARQTLNLAIQESEVKKAMIDLEYALLEAQRQQLADDLRARREKLSDDPRNATRIAQLNSTIERLESVNTATIAQTAKDAIDLNIQNARTALQTALTPKGRGGFFDDLTSVMSGARELRDQIEKARADRAQPIKVAPIVAAETIANRDILAQGVTDPIVSSNTTLVEKINEWIIAVEKMTGATTSSVTSSATGRAGQALDFFKKRGYSDAQAAGIVGNLQHESGLRTTASNNVGGGHVGLAQWGKARQREFREKFGKDLINATFEEQLQFIDYELNKYAMYGKEQILKSLTAADAARAFNNKFERPGNDGSLGKRIGYANSYLKNAPIMAPQAPVPVTLAANDNDFVATARGRIPDVNWETSSRVPSAAEGPLTGMPKSQKDFSEAYRALDVLDAMTAKTKENLAQLGPDGEYVSAVVGGMESIASNTLRALEVFDTGNFADKFTAVAAVTSTALATIQSATAAQARAKEEAIDREITAEQRRDGKSAESVAKIAALEKKKDEIAKKQFNTNKKLMMAQAVISTAAGVAQALSYGFPVGPILAGVIGAMGAAQLAIISGTQYQSSAASAASAQATPASLTIGKRGDTVDLARQNSNVGGELGYLRGRQGTGTNSGNYSVIGSAYGGDLGRGYGNTAYSFGEKGPETIEMDTPITIRPANDNSNGTAPIDATINIHAVDARGVEELLQNQRGNLISMFREAANSRGQPFMESVNVSEHSRPNTASRL